MSNIYGLAACKAELKQIIAETDSALATARPQGAQAVADAAKAAGKRLVNFTNSSFPDDESERAAVNQLDALALRAREHLVAIAIGVAVDTIASYSDEVDRIGRQIGDQARGIQDDTKRLRLEPVQDAIARIGDAIDASKSMVKSLRAVEPDEKAILDAVAALDQQFAAVRAATQAVAEAV